MTSAKRLRKSICNTILSVGTKNSDTKNNAPDEGIGSQLDKIFASYFEEKDHSFASSDSDEDDDNLTPLMMACDKCCSEALFYLQNQIRLSIDNEDNLSPQAIPLEHLVEAWGHPSEVSSCGNSAAHHALAVGFSLGFDTLEHLWGCFEDEMQNARRLRRYISLLSQTNQNGDTPLMMACVSGHVAMIEHILVHSLKLGLGSNPDHIDAYCVEKTWQSLTDVFRMGNIEECTALNLACGHGHTDIVRFFIQSQQVHVCWNNNSFELKLQREDNDKSSPKEDNNKTNNINVYNLKLLVNATYADVDFCKKAVENLAAGLKFMKQRNQQDKIKEFDDQHKQARDCLVVLECELERISTLTANELLLDSNDKTKQRESITKPVIISNVGPKSKGKSKKKKKQKRNSAKQKQAQNMSGSEIRASEDVGDANTTTDNGKSHASWAAVKDEPEKELDTDLPFLIASPFITLQDGSVISRSQKSEYPLSIKPDHSSLDDAISNIPVSSSGTKPKTLQSILESTTSSIISPAAVADDGDVMAAVMESLCLDPSMLLLSSHGMAMEMSPSQLEAIESILNHQLNATKEAQKIQNRLLDK